eukprot:5628275-Prymnesium_polylepis.1
MPLRSASKRSSNVILRPGPLLPHDLQTLDRARLCHLIFYRGSRDFDECERGADLGDGPGVGSLMSMAQLGVAGRAHHGRT